MASARLGIILAIAAVMSGALAQGEPSPVGKPSASPVPAATTPASEIEAGYRSAAIIPIQGEISDVTTESLRRRIKEARDAGATLLVFEIDTPGGLVSSALDIADMIKGLDRVHTVAWVNSQAYSAGSLISLACDEIVMSPASHLGDCGVILGGPTGVSAVPDELRPKAESPVLEQFRDSAARHGYDPVLVEGFVVKERVIYWIENKVSGQRRFVLEDEKKRLIDDAPPGDATPADATAPGAWKLVESYHDPVTNRDMPVAQPVKPSTELLTLSQSRAYAFGFCKGIVRDVDDIRDQYKVSGEVVRLKFNWAEKFTGYLTSMPVRMFLLVIIMLGVYVEFHTPGVVLPGLVAVIALAIFVGAPYMTGLANVWEILLVVIGIALIGVEVFILPGFGIAGILGALFVLVGLLATFIPNDPGQPWPIYWPQLPQGVRALRTGVYTLAGGLSAGVAAMIVFARMAPRISWLHAMIPPNPTAAVIAADDPYAGYARVGDIGIVETTLRPAGKARFGPRLVDVVAEGDYIEPPADVEVIDRRGNRVVVRRVRS